MAGAHLGSERRVAGAHLGSKRLVAGAHLGSKGLVAGAHLGSKGLESFVHRSLQRLDALRERQKRLHLLLEDFHASGQRLPRHADDGSIVRTADTTA
jgi:hypothetical protein